MTTMDCQQCQERFSEYLDRRLTADDLRALEGHLAACAHCAGEYRLFAQAVALLRHLPQAECPAAVLAGVRASIHRQTWAARLLAFLHRWHAKGFSFSTPAAVATVAVAVFAMLVIKGMTPTPGGQRLTVPGSAANRIAGSPASPRRQLPAAGQPEVPRHLAPIYAMFASSLSPYTDSNIEVPEEAPASGQPVSLLGPRPDLAVTVHSRNRQERFNLCRRLMTDRRWQTRIIAPDALLVTLDPTDLHAFHHLFQGEEVAVYPPAAREPGYGQPKRRLAAVVVLR